MCHAVHFPNPLDLSQRVWLKASPGITVGEWLVQEDLWPLLRTTPTVVTLNGEELLEEQYDKRVIEEGDIVALATVPEAGTEYLIYYAIAILVLTLVVALTLPGYEEPGLKESEDDLSNHNLSVRSNRARLGQAKPVLYGKHRVWPDLSAKAFSEFDGDGEQLVTLLYEITEGECTVDTTSLRFEDTNFSDFEDAEYEIIQPGDTSALFPSEVNTASTVSDIEITGTHGPYAANEPATQITQIGVDLVAPGGIWYTKKNGSTRRWSVQLSVDAREIDDAGTAIGAWSTYRTVTLSSRQRESLRRSVRFSVPAGRYEVRVVRVTALANHERVFDAVHWSQLRGYLADSLPTTTTTRAAVRIRSSGQLGNRALTKFSLVATRKLPIWNGTTWSSPTETTSPAWAFADACRNTTYGGSRGDAFVDLDGLLSMATSFAVDGFECNGFFDTKTDLWAALTRIAQTALAMPIDRAGIYTMVQDAQQSVPVQMFNMRNIVRDSFSSDHAGVLEETADSVHLEYYDEGQDYRRVTMECVLPGGTNANPRKVMQWGVTDSDQAFEIGMRMAAMNKYRRHRVEFETGKEGRIPTYGDLVRVSHFQLGVEGTAPVQISSDVLTYDGTDTITITEDATAPGYTSPYVVVPNLEGEPVGAFACTVLSANAIQITDPGWTVGVDDVGLVFASGYERPRMQMGEGSTFDKLVKVTKITPTDVDRVKIEGFVDDPAVYTITSGEPVPTPTQLDALQDLLPRVSNLVAFGDGTTPDPDILLTWNGTNSDRYLVEHSTDGGTTWVRAGITTEQRFVDIPDATGSMKYRVSGVSVFQGPWTEITIDTAALLSAAVPDIATALVGYQVAAGADLTVTIPGTDTAGAPTHVDIYRASDGDTLFADATKIDTVVAYYNLDTDAYTATYLDSGVSVGDHYYFAVPRNPNGEATDHYPTGTNPGVQVTVHAEYAFPPTDLLWGVGSGSIRLFPNETVGGDNDGEIRVSTGYWDGAGFAREQIAAEVAILTNFEGAVTIPGSKIGLVIKNTASVVGVFGSPVDDSTSGLGSAAAEGFYVGLYDIAARTFEVVDNLGNSKAHTLDPDNDRVWATFRKTSAATGLEDFKQLVPYTSAQAGSNLYDSAANLLADIDVRNDQLVEAALGFLNHNPSFSLPRLWGSIFSTFVMAPSGWFSGGADASSLIPAYEDPTTRDVMLIPDGTVAVNAATRVNTGSPYEFVALVRAESGTIDLDLRAEEYDSDELPAGKTAISQGTGESACQTRTRLITVHTETGIGTTYQLVTATYTPTSTCKWFSMGLYAKGTGVALVDYAGYRDLSTQGATWNDDITGQPSDTDIRNDEIRVIEATAIAWTSYGTVSTAYSPQSSAQSTDIDIVDGAGSVIASRTLDATVTFSNGNIAVTTGTVAGITVSATNNNTSDVTVTISYSGAVSKVVRAITVITSSGGAGK